MEIDNSNMRQVILDFPKQFTEGFRVAENVQIPGKFSSIIIAGMGGSALPGDLIHIIDSHNQIFSDPTPLFLHRNYGLPNHASKQSLVICVSHSGNTEETVDAYNTAKTKECPLAVITTGGKLAELAKKDKAPLVIIPGKEIQPRNAVGYQFSAVLSLLTNAGIIASPKKELEELQNTLNVEELEKQGKEIAEKIKDTTPLVYSSYTNKALSYVFKIKFNENAKTMAFANVLPELTHNEMTGLTLPKGNFTVLLLRDTNDHPRIQKQMELLEDLVEKYKVKIQPIDIIGEGVYNRTFNTLLLGDWVSYHLALLYKVDPTKVEIIEEFKQRLK